MSLIIEKAYSIKPKKKQNIDKDKNDNGTPTANKGTLKIDATVANQKIVFPTDANLLNAAREESERIIDLLYKQTGSKVKPRDYRRVAGKESLHFSKRRKKSKKTVELF